MTALLRKHRSRRRRRSHRTARTVTLVLASLSLLTGVTLTGWGIAEDSAFSRGAGYAYLGGAALCLALYAMAAGLGPFAPRGEPLDRSERPQTARSGMALLVVLLLMALVSGSLLHGLVLTHQRLREAEWRRDVFLLRAAARDAALAALRSGAQGQPLPLSTAFKARQPSGIVTETRMRPLDRASLPPLLNRPDAPVFGDCYELVAEASRAERVRRVSGLVCRLPTGDMRVVAWSEAL